MGVQTYPIVIQYQALMHHCSELVQMDFPDLAVEGVGVVVTMGLGGEEGVDW